LWIDECLSPTLVEVAQRRHQATCNQYRGLLHASDRTLYTFVSDEEWVFATNNDGDFRALTERAGLHAGLILLPQRARSDQRSMLEAVLDYIDSHSQRDNMPPGAWMTNRIVEYHDEADEITTDEWPATSPDPPSA
jgi:predicted nuclease of predicted toxin-antitoxin system